MTDATAMTLSLAIFLALLFAALYIIFCGGGLFARRDRPRRQTSAAGASHRSRHAA